MPILSLCQWNAISYYAVVEVSHISCTAGHAIAGHAIVYLIKLELLACVSAALRHVCACGCQFT